MRYYLSMNINQPTEVINNKNLSRSIMFVWGNAAGESVSLHCSHFLKQHKAVLTHYNGKEWVANITVAQTPAGRFSYKRMGEFATQVLAGLPSLADTNPEVAKVAQVINSLT